MAHIRLASKTSPLKDYYILCYDAKGEEVDEMGEKKKKENLSESVVERLKREEPPYTDVFIISHGWNSDFEDAKKQYDKWIPAMFKNEDDICQAKNIVRGFKPLVIGFHWPSKLPDDEIISHNSEDETTDDKVQTLQAKRDLVTESVENQTLTLSLTGNLVKEAKHLRTFWMMKNRAFTVGESGGNKLLATLQAAAKNAHVHLMGHSFGSIVVSAMISGPAEVNSLHVHSLFLVQGALSQWSFAAREQIPGKRDEEGQFHHIIDKNLIEGPILATTSQNDTALKWYKVASRIHKDILLARITIEPTSQSFPGSHSQNHQTYALRRNSSARYTLRERVYQPVRLNWFRESPEYGAVGIYGIRGLPSHSHAMRMRNASQQYKFKRQRIYNLESSNFIGGHSDIADKAVMHAFWAAIMTGRSNT